jgi:hypothetical protein
MSVLSERIVTADTTFLPTKSFDQDHNFCGDDKIIPKLP